MARIIRPDTAFQAPRRKAVEKRPKYLKWLHQVPCLITGTSPVEVAHLRFACPRLGKPETGMGRKSDDRWCIPLCPDEHRRQHSMGEADYWRMHGIDPFPIAAALYGAFVDDDMPAAIMIVTLNRSKAA